MVVEEATSPLPTGHHSKRKPAELKRAKTVENRDWRGNRGKPGSLVVRPTLRRRCGGAAEAL